MWMRTGAQKISPLPLYNLWTEWLTQINLCKENVKPHLLLWVCWLNKNWWRRAETHCSPSWRRLYKSFTRPQPNQVQRIWSLKSTPGWEMKLSVGWTECLLGLIVSCIFVCLRYASHIHSVSYSSVAFHSLFNMKNKIFPFWSVCYTLRFFFHVLTWCRFLHMVLLPFITISS